MFIVVYGLWSRRIIGSLFFEDSTTFTINRQIEKENLKLGKKQAYADQVENTLVYGGFFKKYKQQT